MTAAVALALLVGANDTLTYAGDRGRLEVRPPRIEAADIQVDGWLEESAWDEAAVMTGFTRYYPTEGVPAREPTSVRVFYDRDAIYFAVKAEDSRPDGIFANVSERDEAVSGNDRLVILLDTFNRQRQAYAFYVNPLGLQTDGFWIEGSEDEAGGGGSGIGPVDTNPDFIWESTGRLTGQGWQVEFRIPFVSLRFPESDRQRWGVNVIREVRRLGHKQSWAPLSESRSSTLAQQGVLAGMAGVEPQRLVEVNPVVTGRWSGEERAREFVREDVSPELGANLRLGVTNNLTLGGTVNPDFSQVEADDEQVTVNERFALFFPEKRAFFLDGTEIFESPMQVVHTRRIADPVGGAKLSGKIGDVDISYLGAVDEAPAAAEGGEHRAAFNLARLRRAFGAGSTVGLLYTDRSEIGGGAGANRVLGMDTRLLLGDSYTVAAQAAGSWTRPAGTQTDGAQESAMEFGPLMHLEVARSGRAFNWGVRLEDTSEDFRAESGLIRRIGDARGLARAQLNHYPEQGGEVERMGVEVRTDNYFVHDDFWDLGSPFEREFEIEPSLTLRGGNSTSLALQSRYYRFRPEEYEGYSVKGEDGPLRPFSVPRPLGSLLGMELSSRYRFSSSLRLKTDVNLREEPLFAEASRGRELEISPEIEFRPSPNATLDLIYTRSRMWRQRDGSTFSRADIPRVRVQYMLNRSMFVRFIGQYNLQYRAPLEDPQADERIWIEGEPGSAVDSGVFGGQALLSYEPSPGTIFFLGWTRRMEGPRSLALGDLDPVEDSLFMKASYLHRF